MQNNVQMKEIVIQAHYYDLLDKFKLDNHDKDELDFINNEINFYKKFISDFENDPITEQCNEKFKEANLIEYKMYYNYFKDKLRTLQPKSKVNLHDGKKLNLSERYEIAKYILEIDNKIRTLNIPDMEKYKLLGYILGCNNTNARHIMNGQYQGKIRWEVINEYLKSLKK